MTHQELENILRPAGLPWTYHHWEKPPDPPYGIYQDIGDDPFFADNRTYFYSSAVRLEIYSLERDPAVDNLVRDVLDQAEIPYETDFAFIESEGLYETIFEIEV